MKRHISTIITLTLIVLFLSDCHKKQSLVDKAFEGKKFDNYLPDSNIEEPGEQLKEDKRPEDTTDDTLINNIPEPQTETIFLKTGQPTPPAKNLFKQDPDDVVLNFEEAKLYDIIHMLCQNLGVNFIIDPSVKDQTVTISMVESDKRLNASDLLDLVLKLHDLGMVVEGDFLRIVPLESPEFNTGLELLYGTIPNQALRREELVMQIVPLKYVRPTDITTIIKEFLSPSARVLEEPVNNVLIIIDQYKYIAKALELLPIFDVSVLQSKKIVFYQFAFVDALDTTAKLQEIISAYGFSGDDDRLSLHPVESLNGLLVISSSEEIFKELDYWVKKLDREAEFEEMQIFVYPVQNTTADVLATTVSQLFNLQVSATGGFGGVNQGASNRRTTDPNQDAFGNNQNNNGNNSGNQNNFGGNRNNAINNAGRRFEPQQQPTRPTASSKSETEEEQPVMIVDADNNLLIIRNTKREYLKILKTLKKLDILPRQVFLEVTVLNVELSDTFQFGLDWSLNNTEKGTEESHAVSSEFGRNDFDGLSTVYTFVGLTAKLSAAIRAAKSKGYANLLQQPHIMAIDNQNASISVGIDVPIRTTTTNLGNVIDGQVNNPASQSNISFRPTGVSLQFTPHINANGVIRLSINLEISSLGAPQNTEGQAVPINKNQLATEMIVRDNQTIVMGGLILDDEAWTKTSVPLFGRIPLLRHLFNNRSNRSSKKELIVMITPRLIDTEEKSIEISREFKNKILSEFQTFQND